jgi:hypothetical protein
MGNKGRRPAKEPTTGKILHGGQNCTIINTEKYIITP